MLGGQLRRLHQAISTLPAQRPPSSSDERKQPGTSSSHSEAPGIVFPGCGIFFWWQAGVVSALAKRLDLDRAQFAGSSGGAISATLAGCGVTDSERTYDVALRLCEREGGFARGPWGLWGIWGDLVREWLDELLPPDADRRCSGRVHILVHRLGDGGRGHVSEFESRDDLISAVLASVHIPLLMDGSLTARFRGAHCVDPDLTGMFMTGSDRDGDGDEAGRSPGLRLPKSASSSTLVSYVHDERVVAKYPAPADVLRLASAEGIWEMVRWGQEHGEALPSVEDCGRGRLGTLCW